MPYTPQEIAHIANQVCITYIGENALPNWYSNYFWGGMGAEAAWQHRLELQQALLNSNFGLDELQAIHRWGFNEAECPALNNQALLLSLQACLGAFHNGERPQQEASLANFLSLQRAANARIGLARVSKWICFVNQANFAILDSRVSRGLYPINVDPQHRAFPVLPGRGSGAYDQMFHWSPNRVARMYLDYLEVIQHVAVQANMTTAQVEMALFMIGQPAIPKPINFVLRRAMWC